MAINLAKRFGTYDNTPAVWNDVEGWTLANGVWHKEETFTLWQEARVLSEAEFNKLYPRALTTMPKEAFAAG